jgi:hypothetical protein
MVGLGTAACGTRKRKLTVAERVDLPCAQRLRAPRVQLFTIRRDGENSTTTKLSVTDWIDMFA